MKDFVNLPMTDLRLGGQTARKEDDLQVYKFTIQFPWPFIDLNFAK